ncbi:MAG TPA: hypothetical protein VF269_01275 [Rhodanobacteraceae bacterium]
MATIRLSRILFAAALIALGITGLVNGGLALVWQAIPLHHPPDATVIVYLCAVIELVTGVGLLLKPTVRLTCDIVFPYMLLWVVLLEIPMVVMSPLQADGWGGLGEIAIIAVGSWCLFAAHAGAKAGRLFPFAVGINGIRAARWLLILALPMIGVEVIVDAVQMGNAILPSWLAWLPGPAYWAGLTGIGSIAAGLGMAFGILPRLAVTMEAVMLGIITVAYWAPYLHTGRTATTAFIISAAITAGVWLVADTYRSVPWLGCGRASRNIAID